jgi:NADH dehydrogenase
VASARPDEPIPIDVSSSDAMAVGELPQRRAAVRPEGAIPIHWRPRLHRTASKTAPHRPPLRPVEASEALMETPHVVVVGGGFAGLWTVRALARDPVRITLVDRRNHHLFQPLLYQVATAGLSAPDIAAPLRHILRGQANVEVLLAEVTAINPHGRTLELSDGRTLGYDLLVLASGATHSYFGHEEWAGPAPGLKTLDDALSIRRRVLLAFENAEAAEDAAERAAWLNFAIVGGGPTGVELAGTLGEIARHTLRDEFRHIDPASARVRLIEAGPRVLASFPESLSHRAQRQLERLGVEVVTGSPVTDIGTEGYRLGDEFVPARTVLWAAGVAASPLGRLLDAPTDRAGRVRVGPDLAVPGRPEIFVAGDLASVEHDGKAVPGVAPAAKQMGRHVAHAIRARLRGESAPAFRYRDYGNLATIGRMAAVVDLRGLKLSGVVAWWFWLVAHVFFLIGFRNRLIVLINWAWSYWSYQRHARIIFRERD